MLILEHDAQVLSVAFSPDGETILTNTFEGGTFLWEAVTGRRIRRFPQSGNQTLFALFSPDGQSIFSPSLGYGEAALYEVASNCEHRLWRAIGAFAAAFSLDGSSLLIAGDGGEQGVVQIFDVTRRELLRVLESHQEWELDNVTYSSDGTKIIAGTGSTMFIWETEIGRLMHTLTGVSAIRCLTSTPSNPMILAGCDDGIHVWNAMTGEELRAIPLDSPILSLAFSSDGAYLLAGSEDAVAQLWKWPECTHGQTFKGHTGAVTSVAFSPDGTTLLTGSLDATARLWPMIGEAAIDQ